MDTQTQCKDLWWKLSICASSGIVTSRMLHVFRSLKCDKEMGPYFIVILLCLSFVCVQIKRGCSFLESRKLYFNQLKIKTDEI